MHEHRTSVRHVAAAEEELGEDENDGGMLNVQFSPDMVTQMIRIQQDILRAGGGMKKDSETRAEEKGEAVSYRRVESQ